jgi:hypothetical protein
MRLPYLQAVRLIKKENELGEAMEEFGDASGKMSKFEEGPVYTAFVQVRLWHAMSLALLLSWDPLMV